MPKKFEVQIRSPVLLPSHGGARMTGEKFEVKRLDPEIEWARGVGLASVTEVSPPPKRKKKSKSTKKAEPVKTQPEELKPEKEPKKEIEEKSK